ncbi:hypothetical protein FOZ62_017764, partial [Perkinsus olseni]
EALRTGESVLAYFSTFEAVFMTLFWYELLMKINDVSLKLQQKRVRELKQEWQMICRRAGEIANDLEINADFDSASIRMHRRLSSSREALDPEVTCNFFKSSVFERTLDNSDSTFLGAFGSVGVSEIEQAMASHYGQDGINARELATELQ